LPLQNPYRINPGASELGEGDKMKNLRYLVITLVVFMTMIPIVSATDYTWSGDVQSNTGAIVTTDAPLPAGEVCTVTTAANELWSSDWQDGLGPRADAQFHQVGDQYGPWVRADNGHSYLQLGTGEPLDVDWGPIFATDNVYTYTLTGDGNPLNLRIKDWIDGIYTNNYCHIPVTVSCEGVGGCWITGGGQILNADGTYDSYGGNAMTMKDGSVRGEWNHVDHNFGGDTLNHFKGDVDHIRCEKIGTQGPEVPKAIPNVAYFGGTGTYNGVGGYFFEVVWVDSAEGGRSWDKYQLTIYDSNHNIFDVENGEGNENCKPQIAKQGIGCTMNGNLQIHPPNQGHP
jgi:hypothetical protein